MLTSGFTTDDLPIIEQFRAWGADVVEFAVFDTVAVDTAALSRAIEAAGMENCPVCGIWPEDRDLRGTEEAQQNSFDYTGKLIDLASEIGSKIVAGPMYSCVGRCELYSDAERERQGDLVAGHLEKLCAKAEAAGVTLALEPLNRFETDYMNTLGQASAMIEKVGSPALKIHVDTFHMNIEECNPAEAIRQAGDHVGHFHASGSHRGIPGTGHVDWLDTFGALKAIDYAGDVCIETFSAENDTIARAVSIWIRRFDSAEQLALDGLSFLREAWDNA